MKTAIYQSRARVTFDATQITLDTGKADPAQAKQILNELSAQYGLGYAVTETAGRLLISYGQHVFRFPKGGVFTIWRNGK